MKANVSEELQALIDDWDLHREESAGTQQRAAKLIAALEAEAATTPQLNKILQEKDLLVKPSQWMIGGDGWAYDIGFGGIDHVLASGADVNILVLDNEVYSNTGGKSLKRHRLRPLLNSLRVASLFPKRFRNDGDDLRHVYVAQIASGANQMQTIKAFEEAERFPGPSIIIAYTPCITHGLAGGMRQSLKEAQEAVASGY